MATSKGKNDRLGGSEFVDSSQEFVDFESSGLFVRTIHIVPFDSVRRFRATLLLRTTCMCLCCNGPLAVWRHIKPKTKNKMTPIFIGPRSNARVPFDSVRRFRATLLLRTTCMRL